jgi:hypothetical protein
MVPDREVDTTFYDTMPPQMKDLRHLPPMQSDTAKIGEGDVGIDEVEDPLYPIATTEHDTDEGYKRWMALKEKKKKEVQGYRVVRKKFWEQVRTWQYYPDKQTETWKFFTGSTESHSKEYTASIETELGLSKGIFSGKLKAAFKFTGQDVSTFSQSTEHTVNLTYEADCYYLFWQIVESFDLYRINKANPDAPEYVNSYFGYTETHKTEKYRSSDLNTKGGPPLMAAAKTLQKGESTNVGTYLIGKTKFCFKNLSEQEKGEVTLVPTVGGMWRNPWVLGVNPGYTRTVRHAYTADSVKITNSGSHPMEVWTG